MTVSGLPPVKSTKRPTLMDTLKNLSMEVTCVKKDSNGDNSLNITVKLTTPN